MRLAQKSFSKNSVCSQTTGFFARKRIKKIFDEILHFFSGNLQFELERFNISSENYKVEISDIPGRRVTRFR